MQPLLLLAASWYVGGALGISEFGACPADASCDARDQAYKVYGGFRLTPHLALEAGYTDLGKSTATAPGFLAEAKPRGATLHIVGTWPLTERFAVLGRVGAIYGDTKITGTAPTRNEKGAELAAGVGIEFALARNVALRVEWERFRVGGDVDAVTAGVVARF